jgi:hypothetical protein
MLQYMDKLALSQATLFNLTEDLVCLPRPYCPPCWRRTFSNISSSVSSTSKAKNITGRLQSFTLDTSRGVGPVPT